MTERETLELQALGAGATASRNISTNSDTFDRAHRTVTVDYDEQYAVVAVSSSDGQWFAQNLEGALRAVGAIQ